MSGYAERAEHYALEFNTTDDFELIRKVIPERGLVLDVPCGAGRLLDLYATIRNPVLMVDVEHRMTARCETRALEMGLSGRVSVRTADMRTLQTSERPAAVLVPHGGLQLLATLGDVQQTLENLIRSAAPNATLYVDVSDPWGADADSVRLLSPFMAAREEASGEQVFQNERVTMRRRWHSRPTDHRLEVQFSYEVETYDSAEVMLYTATVRWLRVRPEFLLQEFDRLGVLTSALLGHHDGRSYAAGSPRFIVVGRA